MRASVIVAHGLSCSEACGIFRDQGSNPNKAHAPQLLSLRSRGRVPQLLKPACLEPMLRNKRSHRNEKPAHRNKE
ncbi:hypothetical protein J1605_020853 [Eschrichtius robustus]|uniref:Uncharacterized protein n=1 Tax=Eschrichtius robustus TaxID=9764 RepID=A0AB34HHZ7_ESCRO|nr:hypothetical protein J1605_020853 [Eschrichtius robustus]